MQSNSCAEVEVDLEFLNYITTEGAETLEVCAQITRGSIECGIRAILAFTNGTNAGTS